MIRIKETLDWESRMGGFEGSAQQLRLPLPSLIARRFGA
jgi:hypothetical protein